MTRPARWHMPLLLALMATALAPTAAAETGEVTVESALYHGGAKQTGDAAAFFLTAHIADPDALPVVGNGAPSDGVPVLGIEIDAGGIEAILVERNFVVAGGPGGASQVDPRQPDAASERVVLEKAHAVLTAQQDDFQLHVIPSTPGATVPFRAETQGGRLDSLGSLMMGPGTFREAGSNDADAREPDSPAFWGIRIDAPLVIYEDQASQTDVVFTGDMVLELMGATLLAEDKDGSTELDSGVWEQSPAGLPLAVAERREVLLRMILTDASVRVSAQDGNPGLSLAAAQMTSEHAGPTTLLGVAGSIASGDETQQFDGGRHTLPAGHALTARPDGQLLALAITPTTTPASAGPHDPLAQAQPTAVVAVVAVLALLAAAGLGLARRLTAAPDLRAVEAAIEGQRFGRAARLAKRILRARPGFEDAMLGRAIALSRGGRAPVAIAELNAHLAKRDPSDGSLHYVLGLACLDVGREPDARQALAEAVRRTPSLQADVAAKLGQQASSPSPPVTGREVHGYA